jgi:hypothetical protein
MTEPVCAGALALLRLVGALHDFGGDATRSARRRRRIAARWRYPPGAVHNLSTDRGAAAAASRRASRPTLFPRFAASLRRGGSEASPAPRAAGIFPRSEAAALAAYPPRTPLQFCFSTAARRAAVNPCPNTSQRSQTTT